MNEQTLKTARLVLIIIWIAAFLSFFPPLYGLATGPLLRALFGILVAVHLVEFIVYTRTFQQTGESMVSHFAKTMAFGVIHFTEVKQKLAEGGAEQ